jgi:hypothetical protein
VLTYSVIAISVIHKAAIEINRHIHVDEKQFLIAYTNINTQERVHCYFLPRDEQQNWSDRERMGWGPEVMKLRVPLNVAKFLSSWATGNRLWPSVTTCSFVGGNRDVSEESAVCIFISVLKIKGICSSETLVTTNKTAQRHSPEERLPFVRLEDLKPPSN